mmetsp:Transcript_3653/g.13450  ORF Transcript_3653/g.13450 Transcript_3653/m.13450 type:complete len:208 (+) Transcript_3653:1384-2007(+)
MRDASQLDRNRHSLPGIIPLALAEQVVANCSPDVHFTFGGHASRAFGRTTAALHTDFFVREGHDHRYADLLQLRAQAHAELPPLVPAPSVQCALLGQRQAMLRPTGDLNDDLGLAPRLVEVHDGRGLLPSGLAGPGDDPPKLAVLGATSPTVHRALVSQEQSMLLADSDLHYVVVAAIGWRRHCAQRRHAVAWAYVGALLRRALCRA